MYGQQGLGSLSSSISGGSGALSLIGGVSLLPNTSGSPALLILSIATIALGGLVVVSFIATRIALRYFK